MSQKILRTMQDDLKEIKNIKIDKGAIKKSEPEKKEVPKPSPLPIQASVSTAASKTKTPVPNVPVKTEKGHFTDIKSNLEKKGFNVSMSPLPEVKKKEEAGKDFFAKLQEKISKKKKELREQPVIPVLKDKTQTPAAPLKTQTASQPKTDTPIAPIIDEKEVEKEEVKNEILEEVRKDEKTLKDDILAQIKKQEETRKIEMQKAAEAFKAQEILKAEEAKKAQEAIKAQDEKISNMLKEVSDSLNEEEIKAEESKKAILEEMKAKILEEEKKNKEDILAQIRRQEEIRSQEMQKAAQELKKQEALRAQEAKMSQEALRAEDAKRAQEARALQEAIRRQEAEIANLVRKTANPLKKEDLIEEMRTKILEEEKKNKEDILAQMKMQEAQLSNFIKEVSNSLRKEAYGKEDIEKSIIAKVRAEDQKTKEDILMQVAEQEAERAEEVKKLQATIQEKDTQISNLLRGISESLDEESSEEESREKLIAEMKAKIAEIEKEKKDKEDLLMQLAKESEQKREERLRIEAEEQAKRAEAEAQAARAEEERKKQEEEAARKAAEEERLRQEEEKRAQEEAARVEEERIKQEAEQRIAEEKQRQAAAEEEERKRQEEEAAQKAAEEERLKQEEEARLRQEEEKRAQEEAARAEEERKKQEEEAAKKAAEEERMRQEEEAAQKAAEEERLRQEIEQKIEEDKQRAAAAEEEKLRQIEAKLKQEEEKQAQEKAAMEQTIHDANTETAVPETVPETVPEPKEEKMSAREAFWKSLRKNSSKSLEETGDKPIQNDLAKPEVPPKTETNAQDAQIASLIHKISDSMDAPAKSVPDQPQEIVKPDKDKDLKDLLSRMSKNLEEEKQSAKEEDVNPYSSEGYLKKNPQTAQTDPAEKINPQNRRTSIPDAEEDKTYWQTLHNNLREPAISPAQRLMGGTSVAVSPYDNKDTEKADTQGAGSGLAMPDEVRTAQQRIMERRQAQTSYANPENRLIDGKQEFYSTMHKTIKPKLKIESLEGLDNVLKEEEVELSDEEEKKRLRQNIITKYGIKLFTFPWVRIAILTIIFLAIIGGTLVVVLPKLKNTTTKELETVTVGKSIAEIDQKISAETFAKQSQVTTLNFFDANLEPWKNFDNGEIIRLNVTYDSNQDLMLSRENALKAVLGEANASNIPDNFLKATSSEYNVLAFKESGSLRLGLVFKYTFSKEEEFKDIMAEWEKTNTKSKKVYTVMKNLFVNSRIIEQDVLTFQPAMYNGTELKFVNLPDSDTSMDYFMYEGYIVFTSSKDHTFQMIDLLKS